MHWVNIKNLRILGVAKHRCWAGRCFGHCQFLLTMTGSMFAIDNQSQSWEKREKVCLPDLSRFSRQVVYISKACSEQFYSYSNKSKSKQRDESRRNASELRGNSPFVPVTVRQTLHEVNRSIVTVKTQSKATLKAFTLVTWRYLFKESFPLSVSNHESLLSHHLKRRNERSCWVSSTFPLQSLPYVRSKQTQSIIKMNGFIV